MEIYKRHMGNFAVALGKLARAKTKQAFATPAQGMQERMRQGIEADISTEGAWYNASFNEVGGRILGTRAEFNPLIDCAEQAVESTRIGEFYLEGVLINGNPASEVLAEAAERDAQKPIHKRRVADFGQMKTHDVPADCFGDDDTIVFLAESKAGANKYGSWLRKNAGVKESRVRMQDIDGKDKSRGFWLGRLADDGRSDFYCDDRFLGNGGGSLFGVYESAEGTQKISGQPRQGKQRRIISPNLSDMLKYSRPFVHSRDWKDFERGLRAKFEK